MNTGINPKAWKKLTQVSPDMFCTFDQNGKYNYVSSACKSILGYCNEEIIGRHYTEFLQPDNLVASDKVFKDVVNGLNIDNFENWLIHKNGNLVPVSWSAVWSNEDKVMLCVARDITEHKKSILQLAESEQRYRAYFENNPDVIFIQDKDGLVTDVNRSFCNAFGLSKEEAVNCPTTSFLPPEMVPVCVKYFQESLQGNVTKYEIEFITANNKNRIYDVIKFPITMNGGEIYIKTIMKDVTPMLYSFETIKQQAAKLSTIFESITDAFLTLDRDWNITYINNEAGRLLHLNRENHIGKCIWKIFPEEFGGESHTQYIHAFETGEAVHFTTYLKQYDIWFQVKAYPSTEGLSIYFDDVTEAVKSKQELEKLSLVASKTNNGVIITDSEGKIEWTNEGFTKLTGYTYEEVVGRLPTDVLLRHESEVKNFESVYQQMQNGEPVYFEILNYKKNGEEIWLSVHVDPSHDENGNLVRTIAIQTDITERVRFQQELEKLSLVASKTNNSVLIADKDWRIEWVNGGFTRLMGYSMEEAVGKRPSELLHNHSTDKRTFELLEERLLKGEAVTFEVLNEKKSGEEIWLNVDISPTYDGTGELSGYIEVQTDITALKESELELKKLANDLFRQNKDLQQFTYIVSHNLRSPVANALGLTDLLTKVNKESELFDKTVAKLNQSISKLDTVLKDMNKILSIRDSKGSLEQEQVNIVSIINQTMLSLKGSLQRCGGKVIIDIEEGLFIHANKAYLYSIFYNFLSNAIKYRSRNHALIVHIKCFGNTKNGLLISFADNGSGFDLKKAGDNVFRLYKRFHTDKKGKGIGLHLVKSHLEAMGGHVEVNSQVGKGTRFLIYLPKV